MTWKSWTLVTRRLLEKRVLHCLVVRNSVSVWQEHCTATLGMYFLTMSSARLTRTPRNGSLTTRSWVRSCTTVPAFWSHTTQSCVCRKPRTPWFWTTVASVPKVPRKRSSHPVRYTRIFPSSSRSLLHVVRPCAIRPWRRWLGAGCRVRVPHSRTQWHSQR